MSRFRPFSCIAAAAVALLLMAFAAPAVQQTPPKPLQVADVVQMLKLGISEEVIITRVNREGRAFDLSTDEMLELKKAGASNNILKAMMSPSGGGAPAAAPAVPVAAPAAIAPVAAVPTGLPTEIGVYYKKAGEWAEVLPEVVNWKTGGVMKSIATVGVVKGDVNGNIAGPNSRNSAKSPLEFLIVSPEGSAITEYQLIRLRLNKDNREFRTITGGVFHVSSGANRDLVPFEGKKIAPRVYSVVLPNNLGAGEYGFLPPGASGAANNRMAALGKMYTFRLIE